MFIKKISIIFLFFVILSQKTFAEPDVMCEGLPGCESGGSLTSLLSSIGDFIGNFLIQYVAVFAVIGLMISGIMYLISSGEEEKVKKAKTWIIWCLVGVFLSVSAWYIINFINNITIS